MEAQLFYMHSLLTVLCAVSLLLFAAALIGTVIGRGSRERIDDKSQIGTIQASMLGILGLLLGFTFAVASSRYDERRVLAIDEANALGTTFMRAQTLPEPHRSRLSDGLRGYIDLRARTASLLDYTRVMKMGPRTEHMQQAIWRQATLLGREHNGEMASLFLSSLNQSIDLYASRVATFHARVPGTILWILLCIAAASLGMVGYGFGVVGQRGWLTMALVAVMVAAVMVMIIDLDRPETGPTRIDQQTMIDLSHSLSGYQSGK